MNAALHDDLLRSIQDTVSCPSIWSQSAPSTMQQSSSRGRRMPQIMRDVFSREAYVAEGRRPVCYDINAFPGDTPLRPRSHDGLSVRSALMRRGQYH